MSDAGCGVAALQEEEKRAVPCAGRLQHGRTGQVQQRPWRGSCLERRGPGNVACCGRGAREGQQEASVAAANVQHQRPLGIGKRLVPHRRVSGHLQLLEQGAGGGEG